MRPATDHAATGPAEAFAEDARAPDETLIVDVDGFEGPLDLLLALAREQKVDLARISVLALVEQYLAFIAEARRLKLEIAADYLVMAAWLAYLKSRLLLPDEAGEDEPRGAELAAALAFRLKRLEAMRDAAARLVDRNRLGRDVFARGAPEPVVVRKRARWDTKLHDLLEAYAAQRERSFVRFVRIGRRAVITLAEARERLVRLIGPSADWTAIDCYIADYLATPELQATARASALSASLELVREGEIELRQSRAFAPLYVRRMPTTARPRDKEDDA